jgi:ribosomal protein L37AE/L43A
VFWGYRKRKRGKEIWKKVPSGSRRDSISIEQFMIQRMEHAECPNCDANLDLRTIGSDMIYHCDYCDATGEIRVVRK